MRSLAFAAIAIATAAGAQQAPPAPAPANPPVEKVRCHTRVETGSLARTVKECHTPSEWQRIANQGRDDAEYYRQTIK